MTDPRRLGALAVGWVALALTSGCYTFDDGTEVFEAAERGDVAAIHALGELGDPRVPSSKRAVRPIREAYPILIMHLDDEDPFRRLAALESIRRLAERRRDQYRLYAKGSLDPLLGDPDPEIRWRAAWALGRIGFPCAGLRAATTDPEPRVAERAVWAIGEARDEEAVPELLAALARPAPVGQRATWALQRATGLTLGTVAEWRQWARDRKIELPPKPPR